MRSACLPMRFIVLLALAMMPLGFAQAAGDVTARIVLQSKPQVAVEVAAWTPDDRYVLTGIGTGRSIVIWDAHTGIIIDIAKMPAPEGVALGGDYLRLTGMDVAPDGRSVLIHGISADLAAGGKAVSREFSMDLSTREIRPLAPKPLPAGTEGIIGQQERIAALSVIYEQDKSMTPAAADRLLPRLPISHDGQLSLTRSPTGIVIRRGAQIVRTLAAPPALGYADAALAPDGQRLAMLTDAEDEHDNSAIEFFDITSAKFLTAATLTGDYGYVEWLNPTTVLATPASDSADRDEESESGSPAPALLIDGATGRTRTSLGSHCFVRPMPDGNLVAATLANCRGSGVAPAKGLELYDAARGGWRTLPVPDLGNRLINELAVAPDNHAIAMIVQAADGLMSVLVINRTTGKMIDELAAPRPTPQTGGVVLALRFAADSQSLIVGLNAGLHVWVPGGTAPSRPTEGRALFPQLMATDGTLLIQSNATDDGITRTNLQTGVKLSPLAFDGAVAGGFVPGKPFFWAVAQNGGVRLWNTRDWSEILTTYHFKGQGFLAVTPRGDYDTNLGPDSAQFRWIVSDEPFQSLAPQTFMRDYFQPRLTQTLLECTAAANCAPQSRRAIADLNRALPKVEILGVEPDEKPNTVAVHVLMTETTSSNGRFRSGIFNPRLFRNNRFVAHTPDEPWAVTDTIDNWRKVNRMEGDTAGQYRLTFTAPMPTGPGTEKQEFSVYAFNSDRVKSDTARFTYTRPPVTPRQPRAFIVTIGIDAYDEARLKLNFAASDAQLLGERLAQIPGYDVRRVSLLGKAGPDGKVLRVTNVLIDKVLGILAGFPPAESIAELAKEGVDASELDNSAPDDIVIISFSGHGWADKAGNFYLVPADGSWPAGAEVPSIDTLLSSARLTMWLRAIQAADIAFVIDACHSAASVDAKGFKPGPMGDSGLGQLAFDKGIRILAAAQASDVAMEDPVLRQGLLTYALASEGLSPSAPKADLNGDGRITLDEWLRYATQRLPSLSNDVKLGRFGPAGAGGARGFAILDGQPSSRPRVQEPSLFDFTGVPSPVVLRRTGP